MRFILAASLLPGLFLFAPVPAGAGNDSDFSMRFAGEWSGGGPYRRTAHTLPVNVKCSLAGKGDANHMSFAGTCRAVIVVTRAIGADITYDPASGTYRGTYKGEMEGLAQLVGKRTGDTVQFDVTWPEILNGDRVASMAISNSGQGQMRLVMKDRTSKDGPVQTMWDLTFKKR